MITMKKIALVTSRRWYRRVYEDLYLEKQLLTAGFSPTIVCWTDQITWESYDLVIIRSTWDYHLYYADFCRWLDDMKQRKVNIANGVEYIRRNIDKTSQLLDFLDIQVSTIPFRVGSKVSQAIADAKELTQKVVVKPSISASGYNTYLIDRANKEWESTLATAVEQIILGAKEYILQPYMSAISEGEISLVYFNGTFSHGVRRFPGILTHKQPAIPCCSISESFLNAGRIIMNTFKNDRLLYSRVDLIEQNGEIFIMEVELAEPDLYLSLEYCEDEPPVRRLINAIEQMI